MRKPARLADVAKLAGVSSALVSRIVNDDPTLRVRQETRGAVREAIAMLNYSPHPSARALRNSHTGLIGFALHGVNDPLYVEMVNAAQAEAARRNYSVILMNIEELADRRDAFHEIVLGHRVDGLLIHGGHGRGEAELQDIARDVPSVMFNADPASGIRTVRFDDAKAAEIATQHLIDLGHTEIVFLGDIGATSARRYDGYRGSLSTAGLPSFPPIVAGLSPDETHDATRRFLDSGMRATAFVAMSTTAALGVHSGIVSSGLRIPEDVSLISVHDVWFARHLNPPLSTVALPLAQMGAVATSILLDQINEPADGETIIDDPAPHVVVRGSTARPAVTAT
jgi:LacI family transcriptional regulator